MFSSLICRQRWLCTLLALALCGGNAAAQGLVLPPPAPTNNTTAAATAVQAQAPKFTSTASSDVFGAQLFTGAFAREGAPLFNPDYLIATGDTLQVRLWGAYTFDASLVVDPQGNIFVPNVGPVSVRGVRNQELHSVLARAVNRVYRANVQSYASLAAAQPVRVFVSGFVARPGLYSGTSMDSLLSYLDQAGGIDLERGSFLRVEVKRGSKLRAQVNLYDFLLQGQMPAVQLASGDVIFVPPKQNSIRVLGLADNAKRFEFAAGTRSVADILPLAKPQATATHVRVVRNSGTTKSTEYYPLQDAAQVVLLNGDELEFTADKKPGTITVRVEGEHSSPQEYVLPYGTRFGELMQGIQPLPNADAQSIQLFRQSVKQRQKDMLATSLRSLESALLTARSGSSDEAKLRKDEADLTLQWVERAKQIEPVGQVQIAQASQREQMLLENGDIIRIPRKDDLVLVSGEVLFPNAVAYEGRLALQDYINRAGGFTQVADNARVVVARRDGSFEQIDTSRLFASADVRAGDQILVLPKVDEKQRQFWKDMTQIIYQIAVSAKVVFGL
ncbi:MAG: SLBB domain-containing protein [Giesbergeria sp.]|uniref:polysaccharide biosynthesis/export family protein n=1 Tax=Giesbergeria sp. TaxID=2818473 RepID=UPI0026026C93|nr:polysaccharide biosynthesis/export family protein [Giesbergeria sp.]MDD2608877.1 SLBB domain-containing protein [Giesbergeria sp.]